MMFISFWTSRIILHQLGVNDYGVYSVVGGVIAMMSFLNGSMAAAAQRFFAFDIGTGDLKKLARTFSMSLNIHLIIAGIFLLLGETIGLWFVWFKMEVPPESRVPAMWVYQLSLIQGCINICLVPRIALVVVSEKFSGYTYISIAEGLIKLCVAFLLIIISYNKLILLCVLNFILFLPIRATWIWYSKKIFPEAKYNFFWDKEIFKRLFSFAGWQTIGSTVQILRNSGVNIIINLFFGPVLNTARGLALTINGTMLTFVSNFQLASNPQITKNYAAKEMDSMYNLLIRSSKISYMLMIILAVPIICEAEFILKVWLSDIPDYTVIFAKLIVIATMADLLSGTLVYGALATGRIRNYQIVLCSIFISELLFTIIAYKIGFPAYTIYIIDIFINIIALIARLSFVYRMINFPVVRYVKEVLSKEIIITIIALSICYTITRYLPDDFLGCFSGLIFSGTVTLILVFMIGFNPMEKTWVLSKLKSKLCRV